MGILIESIIKNQTYKMKIFTVATIAAFTTTGVHAGHYYRHMHEDENCQARNWGESVSEFVQNSSCPEDFACRAGDIGPCQKYCSEQGNHRAECYSGAQYCSNGRYCEYAKWKVYETWCRCLYSGG